MGGNMICRLCGELLDTEHPDSIYGVNPESFKKAWMHWFCFLSSYESLKGQETKNVNYLDRQDEYNNFTQRYPI